MERVTITRTDIKTGTTQQGKPWKKIGIQTKQHGDQWLGAFFSKYNEKELESLKEGVTVDIVVVPDGKYLNFRLPSQVDKLEVRVAALEKKSGIQPDAGVPVDDINPDDIPF